MVQKKHRFGEWLNVKNEDVTDCLSIYIYIYMENFSLPNEKKCVPLQTF